MIHSENGHFDISIHAPAKGATTTNQVHMTIEYKFQSTLPRRERRISIFNGCGADQISIHAPAKGATQSLTAYQVLQDISIHAPAKGATVQKPYYS